MEITNNESFCDHYKNSSAGFLDTGDLALYQGFWVSAEALENIKDFQQNFNALDTDILVGSHPKSGTVWLKALAFAIINRTRYPFFSSSHHHPLLTISPHDLVPFVEFKHVYPSCSLLDFTKGSCHSGDVSTCRVIDTHIPYTSLPESINNKAINCKIVYICRNPQDTFVSLWHFINKMRALPGSNIKSTPALTSTKKSTPLSIEDAFRLFHDGVSVFGPYWEHVLGYWKASLERPREVLFLKYENLKKDPEPQLKKLAAFLGYSYSIEEESQGVIKEILSLCSFQREREQKWNDLE
ncbi:cytosolic sulfotransferase 15-like [Papaver somniferum]|uniref:cytosolic sulfotransferase 15-like n=1 Tax=Papaver somniferum TaxID=3469 RepID=UPI000E704B5A|nr:cytosolic sulfotransferase 15-like [Papaver somniferum]